MSIYIARWQYSGQSGTRLEWDEEKALTKMAERVNECRRLADMPSDATPQNWRGKVAELLLVMPAGRRYQFDLWQLEEWELDQFSHPRSNG